MALREYKIGKAGFVPRRVVDFIQGGDVGSA